MFDCLLVMIAMGCIGKYLDVRHGLQFDIWIKERRYQRRIARQSR